MGSAYDDHMNESEVRRTIKEIIRVLETLYEGDSEQELQGDAVLILDDVISSAKQLLPNDPLVQEIPDAISPEALAAGEPIRVAEALARVRYLQGRIGPEPAYSQTGRGRRIPGL